MRSRRWTLWLLATAAVAVGLWAWADPRSFYDSFPLGRGWVAADGPYNEHLLRDFAALNGALGVLTGVAAWRMRPDLVRLAGVVTLVYALPHFAYHAGHLEPYGPADSIANIVALSTQIVLPMWLAISPAAPARSLAAGPGVRVAQRAG